jgi:hypothetical protein
MIGTGIHASIQRSAPVAVILAMPLGLLAAAAAIGAYPFSLRLVLFALPAILALFSLGLERWFGRLNSRRYLFAGWALVGLIVWFPQLLRALKDAALPELWAPVRGMVYELRATGQMDRPTYVAAGVMPTWVFYTTDWSQPDRDRLAAAAAAASSGGYALENAGRANRAVQIDPPGRGPDGRTEIWGRSTGMEWRWGLGFTNPEPYEGWAREEAQRIARAADPVIWVVTSHTFGAERELFEAAEVAGLCPVTRVGGERASAVLLESGSCAP